ncbi:MAG: Spy/CpxP family protein refolding chaperone [Fimbriimonadaceae bacterium]
MKKILTLMISVALVAGVTSAMAQTAGPKGGAAGKPGQGGKPGEGGRMRGGRMMGGAGMLMNDEVAKKLGLTEAQKTKLKAIQAESMKALQPMQGEFAKLRDMKPEDRKAAMDKLRAKMKPQMDAIKKKVDAVLTDKQKKQLAEMEKEMRSKGPGGFGGGKPGEAGKGGKGGKGGL